MAVCPACGQQNPDGFKFCGNCAASLTPAAPRREARKTVTVVFCDVTGSTALGEQLDPESLRRVMARYFEAMRRVIEHHGGTVEKFIGDAVMAVFGIPLLHEDDALRAVRAAAGMLEALSRLNSELKRDYGITLGLRIGVNTGEVVTGTEERLATGDAVNVAARLEQAAPPDSVLLGPETLGLVRHGVEVEPLAPLALKGKRGPVQAYRLVEVRIDAVPTLRHLEAAMVGRENQSRLLEDAFANAARERVCALFTLLGSAGVGKSRLAAEFLRRAGGMVVGGRCLPYGEGITYWPIVEVVKELLGPDSEARLAELLPDEESATAIASLLGAGERPVSADEIAWAVRRLVEAAAAEAPLIVVFDDIHWGEPTFLDLIEHIADWSHDAPMMLLCMARPELLEMRPGWGGGKFNATTVLLEPLDAAETDELIRRLLGPEQLPDERLRERIRTSAEGNPLFVEEMLAMLRESGDGEVTVPPSIQALLAARLDQLESGERSVLERGAVEGLSFHHGAVQALSPGEPEVRGRLMKLVRKELVRPDRPTLPGEDAFRFRHLLIRDAAYDALPKAVRAELHELFARWLDERGHDLAERDEITGYHLEQAFRYRGELGPPDGASRALAAMAAARLGSAGQRASERGDIGAARNLLERTIALLPPDGLDVVLELKLGDALMLSGDPPAAVARAALTAERAAAAGDRLGELHARIEHMRHRSQTDPEGQIGALEKLGEQARPLFEQAGYDAGLAALWRAVNLVEHNRCRFDAAAAAAGRAIDHARRAGDRQPELMAWMVAAMGVGTKPVGELLPWLDDVAAVHGTQPWIESCRAESLCLIGRFDEARAAHSAALATLEERGVRTIAAASAQGGWLIEMAAGDGVAAERIARRGCEQLQEMGERGWLSTQACQLAESLYALHRDEEAAEWAERGLELGAGDDLVTQMLARRVFAKLAARKGDHEGAEALAAEAVALGETIQSPVTQGDARMDLAEVLAAAGHTERASAELQRAAALYERKGATAYLARAKKRLADLAGR